MNKKNKTVTKDDLNAQTTRLYKAEAEMLGIIASKGEALAKKMGYGRLSGMEAIHRYLIERHHWLPWDVSRLTADDLGLLLEGDSNFTRL